ncbi:hypothetical protein BX667DRAFT_507924 [Coemansia mojavensis]|nr:hypothetical protein BX667DRAFT_507924 [Coemansia mojavensis]
MDITKLKAIVKPLMHSVLLKVHPDFFAHQPAAKTINHSSIQRLQELMAPVLSSEPTKHSSKPVQESLEFISRAAANSIQPELKSTKITFSQHVPRSITELQAQRSQDLVNLCRALDIDVGDAEKQLGEVIKLDSQHRRESAMQQLARLRAARAREAQMNYKRRTNPHAMLLKKLRESSWSPQLRMEKSDDLESLNRNMVFFDARVSSSRYADIVKNIEGQLSKLEYSKWASLPIMVVAKWKDAFKNGASKFPGFVIIPQDFNTQAI